MNRYFFFDDFLLLLLDFFDEDPPLAAFFDAAIMLTTFHAVRDLPVALLGITRRIAPANSFMLEVGIGRGNDG